MAHYPSAKRVICPFYQTQGSVSITCEGLHDGIPVMMRFKTGSQKNDFLSRFCEGQEADRHCMYAKILYERYKQVEG